MKQITSLIPLIAFGISLLACNSNRENTVSANPVQNAQTTQNTNEISQVNATPTLLTEKDLNRRAEVNKLMLKGEFLHDGAIELQYIGDLTSVPALLVVLKKNPPYSNGAMICTTAHALQALRKITGANPGTRYEDWNAWWEKYQQEQKTKENASTETKPLN